MAESRGRPARPAAVLDANLLIPRAFPDASVATGEWISLVEEMTCDEKDRHVLAVAVAADATHVVPEDTTDFPAASVPEGIEVTKVDAFLCELLAADPEAVIDAVQVMCDRYSRPTMTVEQLAEKFASGQSAPNFGSRLRDAVAASQ